MNIKQIHTEADIRACYETYRHLRPHLTEDAFVAQVQRQMALVFQMVAVEVDGKIVSAMGFRMMEFLAWGKIIYIDDLVTHPDVRSKGYGRALLDYAKALAIANDCDGIQLDSGHHRYGAHKVYLNYGFIITSHHFALKLKE